MFAQISEDFEKEENFQKFEFLIDLMRRRLQFSILISLPKTFLPSTVNVRWKFWRNWKKKRNSKKMIIFWSLETKAAISNFDIPAEIFLAKHSKCSFKVLKNLKKKQNFQKKFFNSKCSFGHAECSFKKQVEIFQPWFKKSFSSSYVTSNTNISNRTHMDT